MHRTITAIFLSSALLLAACDREPTGQVAAVVNGEEITLQEINTELGNVQIPEGADEQEVRRMVLQRLIERRLMAQVAREEGLDNTPEFLARQRQLEEALLVQLLRERVGRSAAVPGEGEIDQYIAANPGSFGNRTIYTLDRIQFPIPEDLDMLKALEDDQTMDQVAQTLNSMGIQYSRSPARMDSASVGEERLRRILEVPAGEPFVTPEGNMITVAVITDRQTQPIDAANARPVALERLREEGVQSTLRSRLEAAKQSAEITYAEGFDPDAEADEDAVTAPAPAPAPAPA